MDFDNAKENIQPLAQGRNASILQASLKVESSQELLAQRKELEREIHNYSGDDPLNAWYNYICWIEQSFPSGGKESGLREVLTKCLTKFENDERYKQDRRMIRLYIKYIDNHKDSAECYQQLFNAGIGTMVSDFYIAWAYGYDLVNNTLKADEIFRRGIACRAQPLEELQEAHQHFGFTLAQRLMYKDNDDIQEESNRQIEERRRALSSLRGHRRKQLVGSVRTGTAVKSDVPGIVKADSSTHQRSNVRVNVFKDENENPNIAKSTTSTHEAETASEEGVKSVVRSIIDAQRDQENLKEPGPWNKAHSKGKLFGKKMVTNELGFEIHEDGQANMDVDDDLIVPISLTSEERKFDKPIWLPHNFCSRNKPQTDWVTPITTEERPDKNVLVQYNKCKLYPRPNVEFQPEELKAYNFFKKRNIENGFTKNRDMYWGRGPRYNIRQYPHFAKHSNPQKLDTVDEFFAPPHLPALVVPYKEMYNLEEKVERQFEEILALRVKRNETIINPTDMEETICATSEKIQRRKSFFPMRKSLAPCANRGAIRKVSIMPNCAEDEFENADETSKATRPSLIPIFENRSDIELPKILSNIRREPDEKQSTSKGAIPKKSVSLDTFKELGNNCEINVDNKNENHKSKASFNQTEKNAVPEVNTNMPICSTLLAPKATEEISRENLVGNLAVEVQPTSMEDEPVFQFKTPGLPPSQTKTNKLPFEIFEDNASNEQKGDLGCGNGGYFDADESCSTQTFNIFIKAQSVSTPKAKSEPQKLFSNILKEKAPTIIKEQEEDDALAAPMSTIAAGCLNPLQEVGNENSPAAVTGFSPQRKQLSTILETSEHGTTHSTHTTGATTKSTISSPEFEQDSKAQTITQHQPTLDTVKERTVEDDSTNAQESIKLKTQLDINKEAQQSTTGLNFSIFEDTMEKATSQTHKNVPPTPSNARRDIDPTKGRLNFSIFEDNAEGKKQHVGNFSRLEEKEDTATGYAVKPVRFQEDKTETISKMMLAPPQTAKFQEDKTETISKMLFAPTHSVKFQEDKTETISHMLAPPPPVKFEEERTETITKLMLAPPQLTKCDDEILPKLTAKEKSITESQSHDNFFEFFGQSPPKNLSKHLGSQLRAASEDQTPIGLNPKRLCDIKTPDVMKPKPRSAVPFPELSITEDNQPKFQQSKKPKSVLRDSFIPDFSLEEDTQPQKCLQSQNTNKQLTNDSFLPNFSHIPETQPAASNESIIPDSQPAHITSSSHMHKSSSKSAMQSFLPNFTNIQICDESLIPDSQPNRNASAHNRMKQQSLKNSYSNTGEGQPASMKNILTDLFMNDFSEIKEPPPMPTDVKEMTMIQPSKHNSSLAFLAESNPIQLKHALPSGSKSIFVAPNPVKTSTEKKKAGDEKYFELNAETEMFGTNISMIKNSTWLPNHGPVSKNISQIQQDSLHIKDEQFSTETYASKEMQSSGNSHSKDVVVTDCDRMETFDDMPKPSKPDNIAKVHNSMPAPGLPKPKLSILQQSSDTLHASHFSIEVSQSELAAIKAKKQQNQLTHPSKQQISKSTVDAVDDDDDDFGEMSIYYKHTPKTPKPQIHVWDVPDDDPFKTPNNNYKHPEIDLNQTQQVIENICFDPNVNPFNVDLINAFLEQIQFTSYIKGLSNCMLVRSIQRLKPSSKISINNAEFEVMKLIGEGAYGAVFCGKHSASGKKVAMKQENPSNLWEYYICLEIRDRILVEEMLPAYMSVDYALIGNNSSILISTFSQYGSLISVCNKIKKYTMKNVDEYVVMVMVNELLEIIDHLHAVSLIHADIKADNFLLMKHLKYPSRERSLQLIDFGVSIDMKQFKPNQTFSYIHNDNSFKCVEMRENRPWTYQLDLFGLAGVIHVLLFGKYMDVEKKPSGIWMHKTRTPRYFNKTLWDTIFTALLNIRDCKSMPNLQNLRALLKEEIEEKENYVLNMVKQFNRALDN
ncbi:bub1-related kinase [Haematobia irritans]|uniref:bub1-related kinase n=1 Tax=Haematobia irritans TaxID=7368 RepID=UPI003F4F56F0